jgi:hypothetical protein
VINNGFFISDMMQASAISEMRPGPKRMAVGYDQFAKGGIFLASFTVLSLYIFYNRKI